MLTIITLSPSGTALGRRIAAGTEAELFTLRKYALPDTCPFDSLSELVAELFATRRSLLFIMATGIVVRSIAPHIVHKAHDPAVLVADEGGNFVISLLSGHLGGANALAQEVAARIGATPVITTATDVQGLQAVDLFAQKHGLVIDSFDDAKILTALILQRRPIRQINETCLPIPNEYPGTGIPEGQICITNKLPQESPLPTARLLARNIVLGIGCRRGVSSERIIDFIDAHLQVHRIDPRCISLIASVDLKSNEEGILQAAAHYNVAAHFIPRSEIEQVETAFSSSDFVKSQIGVSGVCEPTASIAAGGKGRFLLRKTAFEGITLAIFEAEDIFK
ncbi:MAG: cobalamin [Bacteroidetes bacterium]|nr:cobalamin [Bacteroidota bacterium]